MAKHKEEAKKPEVKKPDSVKISEPEVSEAPKEEVAELTIVEKLANMIRPAYAKASLEGTFAVSIFHREYADRIKEWKDLTGKQFPADF